MAKNNLPREARPINHATATKHKAFAGVVKLVDTQDLKSCFRMEVPVQVRPPAPLNNFSDLGIK